MTKGNIILSAGGTGGHLFPAQALAHELVVRGWTIHLLTDQRATQYADMFPAADMHVVESASPSGKNPIKLLKAVLSLVRGTRRARQLINEIKPAAVVGFGGYPTVPPLWAASGVVPTMVHEQNAVMGRANKVLAAKVTKIAGGFLKASGQFADKIVETGNPVRPDVIAAAGSPYQAPTADGPLKLLIFGGSQGAQFFSTAVPEALARLPKALRSRLKVTAQARPEDKDAAVEMYKGIGVEAEIASFFGDLPQRIADAHLVMSRSGASTVSEIAAIGRPAILVPYPHALDHDQAANAAALEARGGALVKPQSQLTAASMAELLEELLGAPDRLVAMADAAKAAGRPDATGLLADLVEAIASGEKHTTP
ncbi:MAG: undecaprenyldiphospho-muramoylpentapeptide beta-N-acetylglucosaminyltransferase [Ahrensia sp.]